jgi:hypothetical protein
MLAGDVQPVTQIYRPSDFGAFCTSTIAMAIDGTTDRKIFECSASAVMRMSLRMLTSEQAQIIWSIDACGRSVDQLRGAKATPMFP